MASRRHIKRTIHRSRIDARMIFNEKSQIWMFPDIFSERPQKKVLSCRCVSGLGEKMEISKKSQYEQQQSAERGGKLWPQAV